VTAGTMTLLPPAPDKCQICASTHNEDEPHNAQSLYYQVRFQMEHGRSPSWLNAMEHCAPEVQAAWTAELEKLGVDVKGGKINPPRKQ
jgi:hypothetical protein